MVLGLGRRRRRGACEGAVGCDGAGRRRWKTWIGGWTCPLGFSRLSFLKWPQREGEGSLEYHIRTVESEIVCECALIIVL